jgi:hypothetical protein
MNRQDVPKGICKLCRRERDLLKSHLMPAALYALCDAPDSRPVRVAADVVMQTSRKYRIISSVLPARML